MIKIGRGIALATVLAVLAVTAVAPVSAGVPGGNGFDTFGPFECEDLGTVTIEAPWRNAVPTGWTSTGEHVIALSFSGTFTDLEGNVFTFSKSFGNKAGMKPFTCTASNEYPEGTEEFTMVLAIVPPKS